MKIPCFVMRGGTSKGLFFLDKHLPSNKRLRNEVILKVLGAGNARGVDGMGSLDPLSNKIAIIRKSTDPGIDIDYLFLQADLKKMVLDDSVNCGNIISAVAPYAIESGVIKAESGEMTVTIRNVNTNAIVESKILTENGNVLYSGDVKIDGVPGTGAPIRLNFMNSVGSVTGKLFPTGSKMDVIEGINVSCIDVSVPLIIIQATELGIEGDESPELLNSNTMFLNKIDMIRKKVAALANLGNVSNKVIPKIAIVSRPRKSGTITSRYFIPHQCHSTHAVTGSLALSAAIKINGTTANHIVKKSGSYKVEESNPIIIEHPAGQIQTESIVVESNGKYSIKQSSITRTARLILKGELVLS
ncbi:2-methylaconitate cis-trans isomerase PrpF family protein [Bacillus cytotoxicus]|uniref:2-methylaconitate cis-trans isomerase PrpF family protein n=1 Tax=Bacillus cytotoxicus TaxID=580165 RepID=UPI0024494BFF|nr:PrpF domain-containing protein [Bacillus cytotoxicus]MDH2880281.1 hypothetical protein [Bacillus cytotoxicus]